MKALIYNNKNKHDLAIIKGDAREIEVAELGETLYRQIVYAAATGYLTYEPVSHRIFEDTPFTQSLIKEYKEVKEQLEKENAKLRIENESYKNHWMDALDALSDKLEEIKELEKENAKLKKNQAVKWEKATCQEALFGRSIVTIDDKGDIHLGGDVMKTKYFILLPPIPPAEKSQAELAWDNYRKSRPYLPITALDKEDFIAGFNAAKQSK